MYTAYALVKFIHSNDSELRFRDFRIRQLSSRGDIADAMALFPGVRIDGSEWLYERIYQDSEVGRGAVGFGRIPGDLEDSRVVCDSTGSCCSSADYRNVMQKRLHRGIPQFL